jgi:hypothetical protein
VNFELISLRLKDVINVDYLGNRACRNFFLAIALPLVLVFYMATTPSPPPWQEQI